MRGASAVFLESLRGTHTMAVRARVCAPGQFGTDPTGTEIPIGDGDVRIDGQADIRGNLDLTTDGTGQWPRTTADLLTPYGTEIYVERGLDYGNGTRELVGLGYYRIRDMEQDDPPDGPIRIYAEDRMAALIEGRLETPRQYQASDTFNDVFTDLVGEIHPGIPIDFDSGSATPLGRPQICDEDRWGFLNMLAEALGKIWYWDHRGRLQLRDPPNPLGYVWTVNAGQDGVLVNSRRRITRVGGYNAAVVSGEALDSATPVQGFAYDADPRSPTYYYGPYGRVPKKINSPVVTTAEQARAAARAAVAKRIGAPYSVSFGAIVNPTLEPWDVIQVLHASRDSYENHILSSVVIPLAADRAMTADTREQSGLRIAAL